MTANPYRPKPPSEDYLRSPSMDELRVGEYVFSGRRFRWARRAKAKRLQQNPPHMTELHKNARTFTKIHYHPIGKSDKRHIKGVESAR